MRRIRYALAGGLLALGAPARLLLVRLVRRWFSVRSAVQENRDQSRDLHLHHDIDNPCCQRGGYAAAPPLRWSGPVRPASWTLLRNCRISGARQGLEARIRRGLLMKPFTFVTKTRFGRLLVSSAAVLMWLVAGPSIALSAQSPPPVQGTIAVEGTMKKLYRAANSIIVTTVDGMEHVYHFTKDLVVHGGKGRVLMRSRACVRAAPLSCITR
jgi:hypothetical protein